MNALSSTFVLSTSLLLLAGCNISDRSVAESSTHPLSEQAAQETIATSPTSASDNFTAARRLAWDAAVMVQHPPHAASTWQAARVKWRQAIHLLETIPDGSPVAAQAKAKLAVYRINYAAISDRLTAEATALDHLKEAQTLAWQAAVTVQNPPHSIKIWQRASNKWQQAIALLEPLPPTTAIASQSQAKLIVYRSNYNAINQRLTSETKARLTLQQFAEIATALNKLPDGASQTSLTLEQIGVDYTDYSHLVQKLQTTFDQFAKEPDAKNHPVYPVLLAAIDDYQVVLKLWKAYLNFKAANTQWLYDDVFNQLVPLSPPDAAALVQKYDVKTYTNGTKVSLRFSAWTIWQKANQRIHDAQQKALNLS